MYVLRSIGMIAPAVLAVTLLATGDCAAAKKGDVAVPMQLVTSRPLSIQENGALAPAYAAWFKPFADEGACAGINYYPNLDVVRADQAGARPFRLIAAEPKEIQSGLVSDLRATIGIKPKFDKVQEAMDKRIAATKAPKELMAPPAAADGAGAELGRAVEGLGSGAVVLVLARDKEAGEKLRQHLGKQAAGKEEQVLLVSSPGEYQAALGKKLCRAAQEKKKGQQQLQSVLLLDEGGFFTDRKPGDAPPPPPGGDTTTITTTPPRDPETARRHLDRALVFLSQSRDNPALKRTRLIEAVKELDAAIEADAGLGLAWLNRAATHIELNELKTVEDDLRQADKLMPTHHGPALSLATLHARQGRTEAALTALDQAFTRGYKRIDELRRDPDFASLVRLPEFEALLRKHKFIN